MFQILLVIHLLLTVALIISVLLQRSEGGALGIGGGGGAGNFMSSRGSANFLTRATAVLAAAFIASSIGLTIVVGGQQEGSSVLDEIPSQPLPSTNGEAEESGPALPEVPVE